MKPKPTKRKRRMGFSREAKLQKALTIYSPVCIIQKAPATAFNGGFLSPRAPFTYTASAPFFHTPLSSQPAKLMDVDRITSCIHTSDVNKVFWRSSFNDPITGPTKSEIQVHLIWVWLGCGVGFETH